MKGWLNPAYLLAAVNASCQRLLNLFPEVFESGDERSVGYLRGTPGLGPPLITLPTSPVRALAGFGSPLNNDSTMFAVGGSKLYQIYAGTVTTSGTTVTLAGTSSAFGANMAGQSININGVTYTVAFAPASPFTSLQLTSSAGVQASPVPYGCAALLGDVGNDGYPAQLIPNGNQLAIVSAGVFYCDNGTGPVNPAYLVASYIDITIGWGGTCTTAGPVVVLATGTPFNGGMVTAGLSITIGGTAYPIIGVNPDGTALVVGPGFPPLNAAPVPFSVNTNIMAASVALPFTSSDIGKTLQFAAQGAFSAVTATIVLVDGYNNAILSASPAPGGSIDGVAAEHAGQVLARTATYLDSFFIINPPDSKQIFVSAPLDGTTWDATQFATKESYPDNIGALLADHQELLVLGESHAEVWQASSQNPVFPFAPQESFAMAIGTSSPWSACSLRDGAVWIASSLRGQPIAYFAQGFQPVRISTHAIEQIWKSYPTIFDVQAFIYELEGHEFWQVNFPSGWQVTPGDGLGASWVYDRTASVQFGKPMWHERNSYNGSNFTRHRAACFCYTFGQQFVGDFSNGNIYPMSDTIYQDNGQTITCIRTMPHICMDRLRQFFSKLQIDLETGPVALTIKLEWSDDGGTTFVGGGANFTYTTKTTTYQDRATFWQMGSATDRVFRITITGNAQKALMNGYLDYIQGIG